jgi:hypothetical protein
MGAGSPWSKVSNLVGAHLTLGYESFTDNFIIWIFWNGRIEWKQSVKAHYMMVLQKFIIE